MRGLPISKETANQFVSWTTKGAWAGIILMIVAWLTIRFYWPRIWLVDHL